ncbi:hypothetical protein EYF80_032752 [Liparis tanakae]|uniref:Uncharacterized protein n=1 Tax=Liparis tanakae TaxID=230148 RepID=A0A4Z2GUK4_9TELE|nr:hypothetical protein EYF80_032752 [Liparis tanakae]
MLKLLRDAVVVETSLTELTVRCKRLDDAASALTKEGGSWLGLLGRCTSMAAVVMTRAGGQSIHLLETVALFTPHVVDLHGRLTLGHQIQVLLGQKQLQIVEMKAEMHTSNIDERDKRTYCLLLADLGETVQLFIPHRLGLLILVELKLHLHLHLQHIG